jgi:preprotein translocase SecF subunit
MIRFFNNANFDFMRVRRPAMLFSAVVIAVGIVSMVVRGGLDQSIDFAGGALVEIRLDNPVPLQDVRSIVAGAGFVGAEVTRFGDPGEYLIKVKAVGNAAEVAEQLRDSLTVRIADQTVEVRRTESVGPKIGSELRTAAFWAVIYSIVGILVYITWRFQFRFAVAAIVALIHDVLVTLTFFALTGIEVSLAVIAAILTIVGYSLNDTIVIFDRIRENMHTRRRDNYAGLVNTSVNETLSRTIITALTTLFVVVCLAVFGGEVIKDFALTLLVGIVAGTYSTIFIASPLVVEWHHWKAAKARK